MPLPARLVATFAFWLAAGATFAADLIVVVSARNPTTSLRVDQVAAIFLGQSARFPDGAEAVPLDLPVDSAQHHQFYARVTGMTPSLLKAHWSRLVFTGRGQPPRDVRDSVAARKAIAENPSLIGYIERDALDASVRPVLVVH